MNTGLCLAEREAVAVFESGEDLEKAVNRLSAEGLDAGCINILGTHTALSLELDRRAAKVQPLATITALPHTTLVVKAVVREGKAALIASLSFLGAIGTATAVSALGAAYATAVIGALSIGGLGALIGAALADRFAARRAKTMNRQLDDGSLFLWVYVPDEAAEAKALRILAPLSKSGVYINDIAHRAVDGLAGRRAVMATNDAL